MSVLDDLVVEANRQFAICNACRYCEGYCAVFPAMERRPESGPTDLALLANLCHDCRACFQACMYAAPHEFALDIPAVLAEARELSWRQYARPRVLAGLFDRGLPGVVAAAIGGALLVLVAVVASGSFDRLTRADASTGAFYRIVPADVLSGSFLVLAALAVAAAGLGVWRFVTDCSAPRAVLDRSVWRRALGSAVRLEYLGGGGGGCYHPKAEQPSSTRRWAHLLVAYGFLATFLATVVAAFDEHLLHRRPPYPVLSLPVLLGLGGGCALAVGCVAMIVFRLQASRVARASHATSGSVGFVACLLAVSVTGLLLLALRSTGAIGALLVVHLATVVALFVTAPYGRFVHATYRLAALLVGAAEEPDRP